MNIQQEIDALYDFIKHIQEEQQKVDELQKQRHDMEARILNFMGENGLTLMRGTKATVSTSETTRASFEDYDAAIAFIKRRGLWHLFERRISSTAYNEVRQSLGKPVPGLREYKQVRLNVRKV